MDKKKLLYLFFDFNEVMKGKDTFLVPMYLAEQIGGEAELVFARREHNKHCTGYYRGVKLTPIKSDSRYNATFWSERAMTWWLIKNARKTDVLFFFSMSKRNVWYCFLYKLLNPKGVCYVKADGTLWSGCDFTLVKRFKRRVLAFLHSHIDIVSVEAEAAFDEVQNGMRGNVLKERTMLVSNGFDYKLFDDLGVVRKSFAEKENIIITVGRIGSYHKNSEFMLDVLEGMDLGDWEFHFIGPVEPLFVSKYEDFCKRNPNSASKVKLIGNISDRLTLWEQYNRAKIFTLTSRRECMAQVYSEALAFGNYIITTDVLGAHDVTDHQRVGTIIPQEDVEAYRNRLRYLMDNQNILEEKLPEIVKLSETKFNWNVQIKKVSDRIKEIWGNA